jgi:putative ABC transport system substrate-binding protein
MVGVGRREVVGLLSGAMVAWPLGAWAQQGQRLPVIGFLGAGDPATAGHWLATFTHRLVELGWIEDRTVKIDARWAEGRKDRSAEIAAEFVRIQVAVIVTYSTEHALIAKQATDAIPIVATLLGDPVGTGLVTSLPRPGGNLTGLSVQNVDLAAKRLELLREIVPALRRLAILFNINNPNAALEIEILQKAARPLGLDVLTSEIRSGEDIALAFAAIKASLADAVYVVGDPLTLVNRTRVHTGALMAGLPAIYAIREFVEAGGLMSYAPNYSETFRRSAEFVDKILRGAKPADIPVEQPTKFDLAINLNSAKALGLTISESFLLRADRIIE